MCEFVILEIPAKSCSSFDILPHPLREVSEDFQLSPKMMKGHRIALSAPAYIYNG